MLKKILIIKTGFSETFCEKKTSKTSSLGDVLRSTFILNYYENSKIDWFCSREATELVPKSRVTKVITELESLNPTDYDLIINLEKSMEVYNKIKFHKNIIGFQFIKDELYIKSEKFNLKFDKFLDDINHTNNTYQYKLSTILNEPWNKDPYILDFESSSTPLKVGFNWKVGTKWPEKSLPEHWWQELAKELSPEFVVSWQQGFNDINEYIKWIGSCDYLVTLDSLGMHISLALKKKTVVLFGPTNPKHVELFNYGSIIEYHDDLSGLNIKIKSTLSDNL